METDSRGYRIDYDEVDVVDIVAQIRERAHRADPTAGAPPDAGEARLRGRLRTYLDLDDRRPYELQESLSLAGDWNVSPEDLRHSGRRGAGFLVGLLRRLLRPFVKLAVNLELPLYKQFKLNLGLAEAVHDLMRDNAELRSRVEELSARIEALELEAPRRDT